MEAEQLFSSAQKLRDNGETSKAIDCYAQAREKFQAANMLREAAECLHQSGVCLRMGVEGIPETEALERSGQYLTNAVSEFTEIDEQLLRGATLRDYGLTCLKRGELDNAEMMINGSIDVLAAIPAPDYSPGHLGMSKIALGRVYQAQQSYDQASQMIKEGIAETEKSDDFFFTSTGYFDLAKLLLKDNKPESEAAAMRSLEILDKLGGLDKFQKRRQEIAQFFKDLDSPSAF